MRRIKYTIRTKNYASAIEYINSVLAEPRYITPQEIETTIKALREHIDSIDSCQADYTTHEDGEVNAGEAALLRQYLHDELTKRNLIELPTRHNISHTNSIETTSTHINTENNMSYNTSELHAIAHEIETEIARHTAAMQALMLRQHQAIARINQNVDTAEQAESVKECFDKANEIMDKPIYTEQAAPHVARVKKNKPSVAAEITIDVPARTEPLVDEQPEEVSVSRVKSKSKAKSDKTGREPKGKANTTTTTHDGKTYAELRSFISAATKSSGKAKDIAKQVAAELGQKSWAATGWSGYAKIYDAIK